MKRKEIYSRYGESIEIVVGYQYGSSVVAGNPSHRYIVHKDIWQRYRSQRKVMDKYFKIVKNNVEFDKGIILDPKNYSQLRIF